MKIRNKNDGQLCIQFRTAAGIGVPLYGGIMAVPEVRKAPQNGSRRGGFCRLSDFKTCEAELPGSSAASADVEENICIRQARLGCKSN